MDTLNEFLSAHHYPLELSNQTLSGSGADFLLARARESRFMLIGEEHGVGSNIDFAAALFRLINRLGYKNYVTEIGPVSARQVNHLLRDTDSQAAFEAFYQKYPFSVPFAWMQEEVELLKAVAQHVHEKDNEPVIGIDQEFIFSPQFHFERLHEMCADPALKTVLEGWLKAEQQAYVDMQNGVSPDKLSVFMNLPLPTGWEELRSWFQAHHVDEALAILDAVQASHVIYRHYVNEEYYDNNNVRALLMRDYFYKAFQRVDSFNPDARFLIKLGANHVSRGFTSMGIQDIGNFISELAPMLGTQSFHVFVLPIRGTLNAWLPFLPESFKAYNVDINEYGAAVNHVVNHAPVKTGWNLYDLRPLRHRQRHWSKEVPEFQDLFLRYDAILMMDDVRASKLVRGL